MIFINTTVQRPLHFEHDVFKRKESVTTPIEVCAIITTMNTASSGSPNMTGRKGSDMSNSSQEVSYFRQLEKRMKYREKYAKVGEKREREAQSAREKINQLQMENEELKSIIERDKYRSTMIEHLIHSKLNKLNEDSSSDEVDVAVKTYSELYAEHGTCNRNEVSSRNSGNY